MFCPACGANNDAESRFCYRCGRELHDGQARPAAGGPAWRDFVQPAEPEPEPAPAPEPELEPVLPPAPQVVVGRPERRLPIATVAAVLVILAAAAGGIVGGYFVATNVDWGSLPLLGGDEGAPSGRGGTQAPRVLISLTAPCKDTQNRDCSLVWDIVRVTADAAGLTVEYGLKASGQAGCAVAIAADKAVVEREEKAGRPGPYLEGARGRFFALRASGGFTASGGNLACDAPQRASWIFAPPAGEQSVKLRFPGVPPVRFDLSASPIGVVGLSPDDPINVIRTQGSVCKTVDNRDCRAVWELGPYGLAADGSPVIFFALRFEGPAGCQSNWVADLPFHQAAVARGEKGTHLEAAGNPDLPLVAAGGVGAVDGPLACNVVHYGFWRFAAGAVAQTVTLFYADFPPAQIPIKP